MSHPAGQSQLASSRQARGARRAGRALEGDTGKAVVPSVIEATCGTCGRWHTTKRGCTVDRLQLHLQGQYLGQVGGSSTELLGELNWRQLEDSLPGISAGLAGQDGHWAS